MTQAVSLGENDELFVPAGDEKSNLFRDAPTQQFISQVRAAFPTEAEYDHILTRKLERRSSGPYSLIGIDEMAQCVRNFLADHLTSAFEITDMGWLTGGASKMQFGFTLRTGGDGRQRRSERLVVRMEPAESLNATSRQREFQLLKAMAGTIPVPETLWVDADGTWFPEPVIIYAYVTGSAKPSGDRARVSGTGTVFGPQLREKLGPQFVEHLAAIHSFDWRSSDFSAFDIPEVGTTQSALWQLNRVRRVWEEDRGADFPMVEAVANWLEEHAPVLDTVSVLHGDYRSGNFLFDEASGNITAWLDWERGYLGDRHRDLAWSAIKLFGNVAEEDGRFLICGLVPEKEFYEKYESLSGLHVDPERAFYYQIFNSFQLIVSNIATGYRVVRLGKSHQDVVMALVEGAVYPIAHELLRALEQKGY